MRNPLRNLVTEQEQNVLLSLCGILLLGFGLQLFAWQPAQEIEREQNANSLSAELAAPETIRIDIRIASKEELMVLPGIGERRAESILEYRASRPFSSVNQIMNISGIGLKTYERMKPMLLLFGDSEPLAERGERTASRSSGERSRSSRAPAASDSSAVNLNTAGLAELCSLSGIGEVKARAIIAYREEHGAFTTIEQIMDVHGIGPGLFERNRNRLRVTRE